jgi:hypothetical protein
MDNAVPTESNTIDIRTSIMLKPNWRLEWEQTLACLFKVQTEEPLFFIVKHPVWQFHP